MHAGTTPVSTVSCARCCSRPAAVPVPHSSPAAFQLPPWLSDLQPLLKPPGASPPLSPLSAGALLPHFPQKRPDIHPASILLLSERPSFRCQRQTASFPHSGSPLAVSSGTLRRDIHVALLACDVSRSLSIVTLHSCQFSSDTSL